jgi:alpha/beta hydrolase family protein
MASTARATFEEMPGAAPDIMRDYDLAVFGYEETEYRIDGTATSYELEGERGLDGRWETTPGAEAPFRTRFVVRRPRDPERFSGTVVVEWHNVSAGMDAAPDWGFFHRHLTAAGHAWVGVSAQKVGIDGGGFVEGIHLKQLAPDRYAALEHPGDAWSFDMFTQVAELVRQPGADAPLRGLAPTRVLAAGESQSAACLVTYINAIDPHAQLFDGYFVHGRPGVGVSIDGVFISATRGENIEATRAAISHKGERIREDVRVPVLVLQSETDVITLGGGRAAQPDSRHVRVWEMAGAAHADTYTVSAGRKDDGTLDGELLALLLRPTTNLIMGRTATPVNAGPQQHYVAQAALSHLVRWSAGGEPPPTAVRLQLDPSATDYVRDDNGNARGGIRTPWADVPTAALSGLGQRGDTFAFLFGRTEPYDEATLARLYPGGRAEYLQRFEASLDATIAAGFLNAEDRPEIMAVASASSSFPLRLAEG